MKLSSRPVRSTLADKLIALAFRENHLKSRALWDIAWLAQRTLRLIAASAQGIGVPLLGILRRGLIME